MYNKESSQESRKYTAWEEEFETQDQGIEITTNSASRAAELFVLDRYSNEEIIDGSVFGVSVVDAETGERTNWSASIKIIIKVDEAC
jgi:hypothetical protein